MRQKLMLQGAAVALAGVLAATPGFAAGDTHDDAGKQRETRQDMPRTDAQGDQTRAATEQDSEAADARELVQEATDVVSQMKTDSELATQLKQAKGVLIVPDFGRVAAVVGGRGGGGVMLEHRDGKWSEPAFYNLGGASLGAQAGATGGAVAFLLMTDEAVNKFKQQNNWSLNAEAGLSIIDWSVNTQASAGKGDVIVWSDTEGLFAGVQISVSDIVFDDEESSGFYDQPQVTPTQILAGNVKTGKADRLQRELPS